MSDEEEYVKELKRTWVCPTCGSLWDEKHKTECEFNHARGVITERLATDDRMQMIVNITHESGAARTAVLLMIDVLEGCARDRAGEVP